MCVQHVAGLLFLEACVGGQSCGYLARTESTCLVMEFLVVTVESEHPLYFRTCLKRSLDW